MNKQGNFSIGEFYSKGQRIGKGSFATVYLGYKILNNNNNDVEVNKDGKDEVAIKVVDVELLSKQSNKLRKHLESEIKIMKSLKHPNIVEMKEVYFEGDEIYMVLEYCRQGDLYTYLKQRKTLSEFESKSLFYQLSEGLKLLRSLNIIHRDLKPQNLLLTPTVLHPSIPNLKIADFGFARFMDPESVAATLCGSPLYMAPEILFGLPYDSKADLWSSGCILLEMLTGSPLFPVRTHLELIRCFESWKGELNIKNRSGGSIKLSNEAESLIGALLKQNTEERISWREFFDNSWIKEGEIKPEIKDNSKDNSNKNASNGMNGTKKNGSLKERIEVISPTANSNGKLSEKLKSSEGGGSDQDGANTNGGSGIDSFELIGSEDGASSSSNEYSTSHEDEQIQTKLTKWEEEVKEANLIGELGNFNAEIKNNGAVAVILYIRTLSILQKVIKEMTVLLSLSENTKDQPSKPESTIKESNKKKEVSNTTNKNISNNNNNNNNNRGLYIKVLKVMGEVKDSYAKNLRKLEHWRIYVNTTETLPSLEEIMYLTALELGKEAVIAENYKKEVNGIKELYKRGIEVLELLEKTAEEEDKEVLEDYIKAFKARLTSVVATVSPSNVGERVSTAMSGHMESFGVPGTGGGFMRDLEFGRSL